MPLITRRKALVALAAPALIRPAYAWRKGGGLNSCSAGFPNATNTGVPTGTTLTTINDANAVANGFSLLSSGIYGTTANNQVIDSFKFLGWIVVLHSGVTVSKCQATKFKVGDAGVFLPFCNVSNCTVRDSTFTGDGTGGLSNDITQATGGSADNVTILRCSISGVENGFDVGGQDQIADLLVKDNYIHDLAFIGADPHVDGWQGGGIIGPRVTIQHNTFDGFFPVVSSCLSLFHVTSPVTLLNNRLRGGSFIIYFNFGPITLDSNVMERSINVGGGGTHWGYCLEQGASAGQITYTNNVNQDCVLLTALPNKNPGEPA